MYNQNQLENLLKKKDLYSNDTFTKLEAYIENLKKWNKAISLTSKSFDVIKHIHDSLMFFELFKNPSGELLDIGSGNGFPSLVIAIICPSLNIKMVESNTKKCAFLRDTCLKLSLNAKVLNENILSLEIKDTFDLITIRGLKINYAIESKIYALLKNGSGNLIIWSTPPPLLKNFTFIQSVNKERKYPHLYIKAQAEQQPI